MAEADLVLIGQIGRPHGLHGDLRVVPTGSTLAGLTPGSRVTIASREQAQSSAVIASVRPIDRAVLVRFEGVDDRNGAAALTGASILVEAGRLAGLDDPSEFYVRDLVGCAVHVGMRWLGQVSDVYSGAANDALVVRSDGGDETLVPFTRDAVVHVDPASRTIEIRADLFDEGLAG